MAIVTCLQFAGGKSFDDIHVQLIGLNIHVICKNILKEIEKIFKTFTHVSL